MLSVLVFMLVIVTIAVAVVVVVAIPQIRSGEPVLSDDGRQAVARAGQKAREGTGAVTGGTRNLIQGARSGMPGRPRSAPADSGPIPEVGQDAVIDLRDREAEEAGRPGQGGTAG